MHTLKIEHAIGDFETWRAAFERDPARRQQSGVRRYRVFRPVDDPRYVLIDLEFDGPAEAEAFLESMRKVWTRVDLSPALGAAGAVRASPRARVVEEVDSREYGTGSI